MGAAGSMDYKNEKCLQTYGRNTWSEKHGWDIDYHIN